jgi:hypothetical protein
LTALRRQGINSMALPPILSYGSPKLQELVCRPVIAGLKSCSLAISEPYAGSDVAAIRGTAVRDSKGNFVVNAVKKVRAHSLGRAPKFDRMNSGSRAAPRRTSSRRRCGPATREWAACR